MLDPDETVAHYGAVGSSNVALQVAAQVGGAAPWASRGTQRTRLSGGGFRTLARIVVALLLATGVCGAGPVSAPIVGGAITAEHPAVGALLVGTDPTTATTACTATLVGCQTVVTAAHCVCPTTGKSCQDLDVPPGLVVYFAHAGFVAIDSVHVHRSYDFPTADVAVLRLATTVTGIEPLIVNDVDVPPFDSEGTIVGFGWETAATRDSGLKRAGTVWTVPCEGDLSDDTSLCWDYTGTDADICGPDAGGPLLIDLGYGPMVAAVASGGDSTDCLPTDHAHGTNLIEYLAWIDDTAAGDLYTWQCDDVPAVGSDEASVSAFTGTLTAAQPFVVESVAVGLNTPELRVALHGSEQAGTNFDLYVRAAEAPAPDAFDCSGTGSGQYAFCRIMDPQPGTWFVRAERVSGDGAFQLVATTIGGDWPECGNGFREPGEDCDDIDLGTCAIGCDADCYCLQCSESDLDVRQIELWPKLFLGAVLGDGLGTYAELDPVLDGITIELLDATHSASIEIWPDDPGWVIAKPERGRFRWRGEPGSPIRRLDLRHESQTSEPLAARRERNRRAGNADDRPRDARRPGEGGTALRPAAFPPPARARSRRERFLQSPDEHAVEAFDHLRGLLRRHATRLEGAAPVDRRATAAEVGQPDRRQVVGERERALQDRVRERVAGRIVRLEPLADGRIAADRAHGTDAAAVDRHARTTRRPRRQIAEVGEACPHALYRRDQLVAHRYFRHRKPPVGRGPRCEPTVVRLARRSKPPTTTRTAHSARRWRGRRSERAARRRARRRRTAWAARTSDRVRSCARPTRRRARDAVVAPATTPW